MLVRKGALNKRTRILLIVLVILILGGGAFVYLSFYYNPKASEEVQVEEEAEIKIQTYQVQFDDEIFNDPQLFSLQRDKFAGFTDQYKAITLSDSKPLPLQNVSVNNPKIGNKLVINWQLPEFVNFDKVRIYRSNTAGRAGEVVHELSVSSNDQQKIQSYQDTQVINNNVYYYLVISVISSGEGGKEYESVNINGANLPQYKGVPTDEQPPMAPSNVQAVGLEDGAVEIQWFNPPDTDFDKVRIYRSSEAGQLGTLINGAKYNYIGFEREGSKLRYYIDNEVESNIVYYYTVTSVDISGNESSKDVLAAPFKPYFYNPFEPIEF